MGRRGVQKKRAAVGDDVAAVDEKRDQSLEPAPPTSSRLPAAADGFAEDAETAAASHGIYGHTCSTPRKISHQIGLAPLGLVA
ncbi:MAG: hypothetical protein BJ554DRAFT_414 [Olpidium bornovanus]|uniref:Uncharacterized protein n=1 Tax=Olpidium bornovanus TaxID=278681 RepID=A0A8H7ZTS4_9FUNG|nr:MAG: hypothetical protein BJ554DRAFT_414 [Olpidium bornovanus]